MRSIKFTLRKKYEFSFYFDPKDWGLVFSVSWDYICERFILVMQVLCFIFNFVILDEGCLEEEEARNE